MNFPQTVIHFLKPFIDKELASIASALQANKAELEAQAAAGGASAAAFVENEVVSLASKNPLVSLVASSLQPQIAAFIAGLAAEGESQVGPIIDKVVAFIVHEESVI